MQGFRNAARVCVSAAVIATMFASSVEAVMLSNAEGTVSVNRGGGFQPASSGTTISSGDRVRVGSGGSVNIVYANGCSTRVGSSQVAVVLATPPSCQAARLKDGGLVVGAGVGIAVALSNNDNNQVSP